MDIPFREFMIFTARAELKKAIEEENFERAAELRDRIKEMEG